MSRPAPLPRHDDWVARLHAYLGACATRPLAYGTHDCALFPAGAVEAMTGVDPATEWRGAYATLAGGVRILRRLGVADHVALAARLHPEVEPTSARMGDLAALERGPDGLPVMGVVTGASIAVVTPQGLGTVPLIVEAEGTARLLPLRAFRP